MSLYPPAASRRLCAILRPAGVHFCARFQQGRGEAKTQNRRKGHLQALHGVLHPYGYTIFPRRQTAYNGPHTAPQGIKQPRPAPTWSEPGYYHLFRAMDSTAQRSDVLSYQAQEPPLHFTMSRHTLVRPLDAPMETTRAKSISGHSLWCSKSSAIVV